MYASPVDVPVTELRSHLREWIERARSGEDVVITERGLPVARIVGLDVSTTLQRLQEQGIISAPRSTVKPAADQSRVRVPGSLADIVSQQRDGR